MDACPAVSKSTASYCIGLSDHARWLQGEDELPRIPDYEDWVSPSSAWLSIIVCCVLRVYTCKQALLHEICNHIAMLQVPIVQWMSLGKIRDRLLDK